MTILIENHKRKVDHEVEAGTGTMKDKIRILNMLKVGNIGPVIQGQPFPLEPQVTIRRFKK